MPFDVRHDHSIQSTHVDLFCDRCGEAVGSLDLVNLPSQVSAMIAGRLRSTLREFGVTVPRDQPIEMSSGEPILEYVKITCSKCLEGEHVDQSVS